MIRIAITPEHLDDESREALAARVLLESGWDKVHLRHPGASATAIHGSCFTDISISATNSTSEGCISTTVVPRLRLSIADL